MEKIKKFFLFLKHPSFFLMWLDNKKIIKLKDISYIKIKYLYRHNEKLDLKNPQTFNEKIQWLKLYDRNPKYTKMVDKYEAKEYVKSLIGNKYIIPTIGIYNNFDDINFNDLPEQFVMKCTHNSGGVFICKDKKNINYDRLKKDFNNMLTTNYYDLTREWPYKNVKPRIIIEKYMIDESGYELKDYKFFCFDGEPKLIQVDFGRFTKHERNIYNLNWEYQNLSIKYPTNPNINIDKPKNLDEMIKIAKKLSKNKKFVRVDLYSIGDKIYFGELTFHHGGGHEKFIPESWNEKLGSWISLK